MNFLWHQKEKLESHEKTGDVLKPDFRLMNAQNPQRILSIIVSVRFEIEKKLRAQRRCETFFFYVTYKPVN